MAKAKKKPFNKRIAQEIRASTKTTQKEIARLAGVSVATVQKVEAGQSKNEKVLAIYSVLNAEKEAQEEKERKRHEFFYRRKLKKSIETETNKPFKITGWKTTDLEIYLAKTLLNANNESAAYEAYRKIKEVAQSGGATSEWREVLHLLSYDSEGVKEKCLEVAELNTKILNTVSSDEIIDELLKDLSLEDLYELSRKTTEDIKSTKATGIIWAL